MLIVQILINAIAMYVTRRPYSNHLMTTLSIWDT